VALLPLAAMAAPHDTASMPAAVVDRMKNRTAPNALALCATETISAGPSPVNGNG
jgi:hypothetical protein